MNRTFAERRQFLEDWGPFMLSGVPMLLAFYTSFSTIPTRPLLIDPLVYFMLMSSLLGLGFLCANVFGKRAVRGLRLFAFLAVALALPAVFIPGATLSGVARLCAIGVVWGMVALISRFNGYGWLMRPLAKLNGVASMPEEWAKGWIAEMYDADEAWDHPEIALEKARADWEDMVKEDGRPKRIRPSVLERVWAFVVDDPIPGWDDEISQADDVRRARESAARRVRLEPSDTSASANAVRRYQSPPRVDEFDTPESNGRTESSFETPRPELGERELRRNIRLERRLEELNEARLQAKL